ncbi:glycosyltransferase [Pseudomonas tohonis]|nr:hypothetical protein L682_16155 [Pseudomonas alcaligenes OT 69]MDN4147812.1 glycosyltransferase [Pseudomonas tohonis]
MQFTGERFIPTEKDRIRSEHYHRYLVASSIVAQKDVLDLASGEGYGSLLLSEQARTVVGVDVSQEAVDHARSIYQRSNLEFYQGTASALDLPDHSFDVVVSFETIEHLYEQREMLSEIRRVLRADGVLLISSPNKPVYREENEEHNPFHVKELDFQELDVLLREHFETVHYLGQRMLMGSVIQPFDDASGEFKAWHDNGEIMVPEVGTLNDPTYFLAVCGREGLVLPQFDSSIFYPSQTNLVKHYMGFARWALAMQKELEQAKGVISRLSSDIAIDERVLALQAELSEERKTVAALIASRSWRFTGPLRFARRSIEASIPHAKRYFRSLLRLAKRAYQSLPLSERTKVAHRSLLVRWLPWVLELSGSTPESIFTHVPCEVVQAGLPESMVQENQAMLAELEGLVSSAPVVSIVIPVYGKSEYTLHCLASIVRSPPGAAFEVIVVDDCSPDDTFSLLSGVAGLRLLRNPGNLGFIGSCNNGAAAAKGRFLHFLNNDTAVMPGWLDELLLTFSLFPGTGLVGSKLVYPDGSLQEAGGIIWQDGSAWNFGRGQDPDLPQYNYAREVDYCSAASVLVEKSLFDEFEGFDPHYSPAYCEDADLALKIRDRGYRVLYQPRSVIVHYEGISCGRDLQSGVKAYQVENMKKMFSRWQARLSTHQKNGEDVDRAKDRMATRRVLILDHCTPTPDQDAGSLAAYNSLLLFREMGFQTTFIPEDNFLYVPGYTDALQREGIEVLYRPFVHSVESHLKEYGERYDLVYIIRPKVVERHIALVRKYCAQAKVLFNTADLHFIRMEREAKLLNDPVRARAAGKMKQMEYSAIQAVDGTIVVSTTELEFLRQELPQENIYLFPLISDAPGTKVEFQPRRGIIFVGGYQHAPNVDAVLYFVNDVMPLLRQRLPGVPFHIVGSQVPAEIKALECDDVVVTGYVEDLATLLDSMRVCISPLRYGAGMKGKIMTSMSHGLPVVASTIAIEGMELVHEQDILIADDPEAFADEVARLYRDEQLWQRLSTSGAELAAQRWGVEAAWTCLGAILDDIGLKVSRGGRPLPVYTAGRKL